MSRNSLSIDYNSELAPLEKVLSSVQRPGDFYASGSLEEPMPRLEIDGVGTLSFPVPESQVRDIIRQASLAPYGRGEQTLVDTSVRKVGRSRPVRYVSGGKDGRKPFRPSWPAWSMD